MHLPSPTEGGSYDPPPAGTYPATCYRVVDLGTQLSSFNGETKRQHKIMLTWEISDPDLHMDDGRPYSISQRYTWSMHEKATLRKHLEAWRGAAFTNADFGPNGFDIRNILGKTCYLSIIHTTKDGSTYANIGAVLKLPKGVVAAPPVNEAIYVALIPEEFDRDQLTKLSDKLQEIVKSSPEYAQLLQPYADPADHHAGEPSQFIDDDIPF